MDVLTGELQLFTQTFLHWWQTDGTSNFGAIKHMGVLYSGDYY